MFVSELLCAPTTMKPLLLAHDHSYSQSACGAAPSTEVTSKRCESPSGLSVFSSGVITITAGEPSTRKSSRVRAAAKSATCRPTSATSITFSIASIQPTTFSRPLMKPLVSLWPSVLVRSTERMLPAASRIVARPLPPA